MQIKTFTYKDLSINSYLLIDEKTKACVVIDPPRIIPEIKQYIDSHHLTLKAILETHVHADFISGALELKHAYGMKPIIYSSSAAGPKWTPHYTDRGVKDKEVLEIDNLKLQALHTPGHTPEHLTWLYLENNKPLYAFTGDFLFPGGIGRPDLLGDELVDPFLEDTYKSLFERIAFLPDSLEIYPAHGAGSLCSKSMESKTSTTLGIERKQNPALQKEEMKNWKAKILADMPKAPKSFARNKMKNLKGVTLLSEPSPSKKPTFIFDFRHPEEFGKGHLKGAINIPINSSMGNWLAMMLPEQNEILCILPDNKEKDRIYALLRLLGADHQISFEIGEAKKGEQSLEYISPEELKAIKDKVYLIDVRTPAEWNSGHIDSAHPIELAELEKKISQIPKDKEVITTCGSGLRSSVAASLLQKEGFPHVRHLHGGMTAWKKKFKQEKI